MSAARSLRKLCSHTEDGIDCAKHSSVASVSSPAESVDNPESRGLASVLIVCADCPNERCNPEYKFNSQFRYNTVRIVRHEVGSVSTNELLASVS
jgi:hypothetical protein